MGDPWRIVDEWEGNGAENAPFSRSGGWSVVEEWTPAVESGAETKPDLKSVPKPESPMGFGDRIGGVASESLKRGGNAAMLGLVDRFAPEQAIDALPPHIQSSIGFNPMLAEEMVGVTDRELSARKEQTVESLIEDIRANDRRIEELTPQEMSMLEEGVFSGTTSLLQMAPAIAAGIITRSPRVAAASGAGLAGVGSYGTAREKGRSPGESAFFGGTDAAIEYATELGPFKVLGDLISGSARKDGKTIRKLTEFVVRDMLGEQAATQLQSANAWAHGLDEELVNARDASEIRDILGHRAGVTAIASVVAGGPQAATGAAIGLARRSGEPEHPDPHEDALDGDEVMGGPEGRPSPDLAPALPPPVLAVNRKGEVQPLSAVDAELKELLARAEELEAAGRDQQAIDTRSKAYGYGSEQILPEISGSIDRLQNSKEIPRKPEKAPEIIPIPASKFGGMSKKSLVEASEIRGIRPGDATRAQLIDAIEKWQQGREISHAAPAKPPQNPSRNFLKKPLHHWVIQHGGVDPSSPIGRELRYLDIRDPGFFNKNGMKSLDGIVQDEHEIFDTIPPPEDQNGYINEDLLVDLLDQEQAGEPLLSMRQLVAMQEYEIALKQWEREQDLQTESEEEQAFQKWVVEHADEIPDLSAIDDESEQLQWEINEQESNSDLPAYQTDDVDGGVARYSKIKRGVNDVYETAQEYEPHSLSTQRGADSLGGETPKRVVQALRRHKTSIFANGLAEGFIDQKHVRLIGQKIKSAEDLAILGQVYRNPAFETFRVFYTQKGKVVGQTGITSRMPNVVQIGDISEDIIEDMERLNADGWWLLHNHPSGNPNPSNTDKRFTNSMASRARGFLGHIVVDHNKYGVVDEKGKSTIHLLAKSAIDLFRYDVNKPSVPHNLLGYQISSAEDAAAVARSLAHDQEHYFQIVSRNISGIRGIMDVPTDLLDDLKWDVEGRKTEALALLHQFARQTGGGELFAMNVPMRYADALYSGVEEGAFLDVITTEGKSIRAGWAGTPKSSSMGIEPKTIRVNDVSEEKGRYGTEDVQRGQHKLVSALEKAASRSGKGQPLDRIMRSPFKLVGGIEKSGSWKPGSKGYREMERLIVEASFDKDGLFSWANPLLEQARSGLIDRYKLTDEYKSRDQRREADVRRILNEGIKTVGHLAESGVSNMEEAKVLQAILTGEKIPDREWRKLSEPIRKAVNDLGEEAVQLGLISQAAYQRNKGAYLHRVYKKDQGAMSSIDRFFSSRRKSINGNQLKGRGMRIKATMADLVRATPKDWWGRRMQRGKADPTMKGTTMVVLDKLQPSGEGTKNLPGISGSKPKGRIVERIFWPADEPIPPRFESWDHRGEWRIVDVSGEHLILWRDFTKAEREAMGEILDARYTIAKTYHQMAYDLSNGRFLKDIALNDQWARTDEPQSWVEPRGLFHRTYSDVEWVLVPESVIPNSGGKKRWGALAGMYVRSEIWRDLNELDRMQQSGVWRKMMTQWKLNKTARSPVVHMNNVMSNLLFMDMADVRIQDLIHGIDAYVHKTSEYRDAEQFGAFGGGFVDQEIRRTVLGPLLDEIERQDSAKLYGFEGKATLLGRIADGLWRRIKILDDKGISAYQIEDELFRMATYMRRRSMGDDAQTAAQIARDQFLNYDIRAPWVNMARSSVLPFISYTYRAVPVIAKSIAERPWKLAKYMLVSYAVNALSYALDSDGDEERERKSMREELQGKTWVGTPRMIRTPWRDDHNNPIFLDVRRWIPAGDVFDTYQSHAAFPVPAPLQFGGPAMLAGELFLNRSAFTGRNITNLKIDTPTESLLSVGSHLWKSWMPSAPWIPGSWYWDKISRSLRGARDSLMREYSLPLAILSSIGIKVVPQDVEMGTRLKGREFDSIRRALDFEMRQLQRDRKRAIISGDEYLRQHKLLMDKMEALRSSARESM